MAKQSHGGAIADLVPEPSPAVPGTSTVCARRVIPAWGSHGQHVLTTGRSSGYFGAAFSVVIWRAWRKDQIQRTGQ